MITDQIPNSQFLYRDSEAKDISDNMLFLM